MPTGGWKNDRYQERLQVLRRTNNKSTKSNLLWWILQKLLLPLKQTSKFEVLKEWSWGWFSTYTIDWIGPSFAQIPSKSVSFSVDGKFDSLAANQFKSKKRPCKQLGCRSDLTENKLFAIYTPHCILSFILTNIYNFAQLGFIAISAWLEVCAVRTISKNFELKNALILNHSYHDDTLRCKCLSSRPLILKNSFTCGVSSQILIPSLFFAHISFTHLNNAAVYSERD